MRKLRVWWMNEWRATKIPRTDLLFFVWGTEIENREMLTTQKCSFFLSLAMFVWPDGSMGRSHFDFMVIPSYHLMTFALINSIPVNVGRLISTFNIPIWMSLFVVCLSVCFNMFPSMLLCWTESRISISRRLRKVLPHWLRQSIPSESSCDCRTSNPTSIWVTKFFVFFVGRLELLI